MDDRVEVYQDARDEWRWRRLAGNNKVIADSGEGYLHRVDCLDSAIAVNARPFTFVIAGDTPVEFDFTGRLDGVELDGQ